LIALLERGKGKEKKRRPLISSMRPRGRKNTRVSDRSRCWDKKKDLILPLSVQGGGGGEGDGLVNKERRANTHFPLSPFVREEEEKGGGMNVAGLVEGRRKKPKYICAPRIQKKRPGKKRRRTKPPEDAKEELFTRPRIRLGKEKSVAPQ